jgi:acetyl-CoA C-acetyltransferase
MPDGSEGTLRVTQDEGIPRQHGRGARRAEARHSRRHSHRRQLVADLGWRGRGAVDVGLEGARARSQAARASCVTPAVVGTDPYYLLDGPIDATKRTLQKSGMKLGDIDLCTK